MAKDYFQDIIPPGEDSFPPQSFKPRPLPPQPPEEPAQEGPRSIPSIQAPARPRPYRPAIAPTTMERDFREGPPISGGVPPHRSSRLWMWAAASVVVLCVVAGLLFFFGSTPITVTPKSRTAVLNSAPITAREGSSAPEGTLSYTMQTFDLEDSEVVAAQGTTRVESKASGSITISN